MMKLRLEHQWDSRKLSASGWTKAVDLFNKKRGEEQADAISVIPKVFQDELLEAEKQVSRRIAHGDYTGEHDRSSGMPHARVFTNGPGS